MAIPDFQAMMRPILQILADGNEHQISDMYRNIGEFFELCEEEKSRLLPSGKQTFLANRVGWALSHLKAAKVVESPRRGTYRLTSRGELICKEHPERVDLGVLDQFEEHVAFRTPKKEVTSSLVNTTPLPSRENATPEEAILQSYQELRISLAQELLEKLNSLPRSFLNV